MSYDNKTIFFIIFLVKAVSFYQLCTSFSGTHTYLVVRNVTESGQHYGNLRFSIFFLNFRYIYIWFFALINCNFFNACLDDNILWHVCWKSSYTRSSWSMIWADFKVEIRHLGDFVPYIEIIVTGHRKNTVYITHLLGIKTH